MKQSIKRPITLISVAIVAALTIGVAVAERMELRAEIDRFSMGDENLPISVD